MSLRKRVQQLVKGGGQKDVDWAICLARWGLILFSLLVAFLDPAQRLSPDVTAFFFLAYGAYSLTITVLLALGLLVRAIPAFTLILDVLALFGLLALSGGIDSPYSYVPLFPILVAALRYGWFPGLLAAMIYSVGYLVGTLLAWEAERDPGVFFQPALIIATYLLIGVLGGAVSTRLGSATSGQRKDSVERPTVPDHIQMIYELASNLSATLNYQRVLEAILDVSRLGFDELGLRIGESVGLVLLYDPDGYLRPVAHRNLVTTKDETRRITGKSGIVDMAIGTSEAVLGGRVAEDPELRVFESLAPCKSVICVPLRAGFETFGCVLFGSVRRSAYTHEHVEVLTIFCNQATIALQNASLYQSLREERDKIIDKEEEARHKLARDLHDGPTQDVAAIAMRLNFARLLVERDPGRARAELARLEDLAHRTVKEIRSMLFTLRPVILETEGLVAALNQYAGNLLENDGLPIEVDVERYRDCLDTEAQGVVFAIIEEAVNNAKKHAQAMHIWVRMAVQGDVLIAQVADDGMGFDVEAVEDDYGERGSLGMINLKERAGLVGGTINIDSTPGQGTRITLLVPIAEELI